MTVNITTSKLGQARCPGAPSTQEIIHRDGRPVPDVLAMEAPCFLGDEDMSYERYISPAFFQREMALLWPKVWQWACREEHIPEPGDFHVYEVGHYSVIVVRTQDGAVKAYYNACLHRGTKLKPSGAEGNSPSIRCPFHGWTWSLDGDLERLPCPWDLPHVEQDRNKFKLPEIRVGLWGGFVFINMDPDAPTLEEFMGVLPAHFKDWDLSKRFVEVHVEKEINANWKSTMEAFMENYHTQETHPQLRYGNGDENTQYDIFGDHVSRFYATNGVNSPHLEQPLTEQELLNTMLVGDRTVVTEPPKLEAGETARVAMARMLRGIMSEKYGVDLSQFTDTEMLDTMEYNLFPNMVLFPGISLPMVYRFRPIGMDTGRTLFELLILRPVPDNGPRPEPAVPVRLREEDSFTTVPGMDPSFGHVFDQDTDNLRNQQQGMLTSKKPGQTLTNYQEVRLRHFEQTVDKYMSGERITP
ncbi:MAG: aromatic ring-hydroxylating dioxygenase subunit alpha [Pseudomonas sp.]